MWFNYLQTIRTNLEEAPSTGLFPSEWKKVSAVPIHEKGDKQILKNYRPFTLLPICGKISKANFQ